MHEPWRFEARDERAMRDVGAWLALRLTPGDTVLLDGELGAGKTTLVRGLLKALGYAHEVRSPTFGLLQVFDTIPPVVHADLYRVKSCQGLGIEDYLESHVCLIEWPDRAEGLVPADEAWHVQISVASKWRSITVTAPKQSARRPGATPSRPR